MRNISRLGGTPAVVTLALIATVVEMIRKPSRALPLFMALVVGGQFALSNGIKYIVERARPDISRLTGFAGTSFPSGHSTAASATFAAIALILTRNRSRRVKIAGASVAAGIAVTVAAHARVPRRPLVHRRHRRPAVGLGMVCGVLDRLRRSPADVRSAGRYSGRGGGRGSCCARAGTESYRKFCQPTPIVDGPSQPFDPPMPADPSCRVSWRQFRVPSAAIA